MTSYSGYSRGTFKNLIIKWKCVFTLNHQCNNRQLIIMQHVGWACFPLVFVYRQGRSGSAAMSQPAQMIQTVLSLK